MPKKMQTILFLTGTNVLSIIECHVTFIVSRAREVKIRKKEMK
jgi:hypothetical protein